MATAATNPKQEAHELIDRMSTGQVSAVVSLLKPCSIPSPSPWPTPPIDDEPVSEEETRADRRFQRFARARRSHPPRGSPPRVRPLRRKISSAWDALHSNPNRTPRTVSMDPGRLPGQDQAKAQLRAIDQPTALRILHALAQFVATGEGDVKRLQDIEPPEFRLRVGDYRAPLPRPAAIPLYVPAVKHRREAYR